jgi:small subunit ribosomal protein S16
MDSRDRNRGRELDTIGYYHPCERPEPVVEVNVEKALDWLSKGAQTSDTVRTIFSRKGIMAQHASGKAASGEAKA